MTGWFLTYEQYVVCYRLKEGKFQGQGRKFLRQEFQKAPVSGCPLQYLRVFKSWSFIRITLTFSVHIKTKNLEIKSQFWLLAICMNFLAMHPSVGWLPAALLLSAPYWVPQTQREGHGGKKGYFGGVAKGPKSPFLMYPESQPCCFRKLS